MKLADIQNPVAAWWQPVRNLKTLADWGFSVVFGPEVEGASTLTPEVLTQREREWIDAAGALGLAVVIKRPWKYGVLPANVVGFCLTPDEPNAKGQAAATMHNEYGALCAMNPSMPIFLSLAAQNITSANWGRPSEVQAFRDYLSLCDVVTVDTYPRNINASRYKDTWPADAVAKIRSTFPGTRVWAWHEANDQQLNPPKAPDVNRAPTPDEISAGVAASVAAGAEGIGFFFTCLRVGWPTGYLPPVDRNKVSLEPQYAAVRAIATGRRGVPVVVPDPLDDLRKSAADALAQAQLARAENLALRTTLTRALRDIVDAIAPATPPATPPNV